MLTRITRLLLILALATSPILSQLSSATDSVNDHCPDNYLSDLGYTADEIDDLREDRDNKYYNNYKDIIEYLDDREAHELFDAYRGSAALMLTLLCLVFVTFILVFLACCGVCSNKG